MRGYDIYPNEVYMMQILTVFAVLIIAYLIGSIPFGWIIVKLATGRDIRGIESGRTGGTNVWRAAGLFAGFITGVLDVLKGAATVWIVPLMIPPSTPFFHWIEVIVPLTAILGHNYSIYLLERSEENGKVRFRGGAGGAACLGGAVGLWTPAILYILPLGVIIYLVVGYASVTTMSIAFFATLVFLVRAIQGYSPWVYVVYGIIAEGMLIWALRPNIKRLREGNERLHGLRVWLKKRSEQKTS
jgi:acyl phosphate:glycerol-3-phosphate acyltransferase